MDKQRRISQLRLKLFFHAVQSKALIFLGERKKNQLQELSKILGMRINNNMLEKGDAGVQDADEICQKEHSINQAVETEISESFDICDRLKDKISSSLHKTDNDGITDYSIYASHDIFKSWMN